MLHAAALQTWRCIHATAGIRKFQACAQSGAPSWWLKGRPRRVHGSVLEVQLLSHLAVLLQPGVPIAELFRNFPTERSVAWGANILSPDLALYGVLKQKDAVLFLEYDGHYRHHERSGIAADERKTEALLHFAPPGSMVLRIAHAHRGLKARHKSLEVVVDKWNASRQETLLAPVQQVVDAVFEEFDAALKAPLKKEIQALACSTTRLGNNIPANFVAEAELTRNRGLQCAKLHMSFEMLGLSQEQISKVVARLPQILGYSIEANLKPTVEWLRDLGLSQVQIAKVVARFPQVLGCSIEANLKPTVEWLRELGLSQVQIAKVVARCPQVLGCSIEANLKPTVEWLKELGLSKAQVSKVVALLPQTLGYSIEANLKPTVEWLRDLGLSHAQVAKVVAGSPQVLGYSIEANLKPTVEWLKELGLSKAQVSKVVARLPQILGYSIEANLKPTVEWLKELGLSKAQVSKVVALLPQILGLSIEANLQPTVEWLRDLGLSHAQVAKVVAGFPQVLSLSIEANLNCKKALLHKFYTTTELCLRVATFPSLFGYSLRRLQHRLPVMQEIGVLSRVYLMSRKDSEFAAYALRHSKVC